MNIIFMGTPEFAVECLDVLVKSNHNILAVVTSEDKPAGRGQKIKISEIKKYSITKNIKTKKKGCKLHPPFQNKHTKVVYAFILAIALANVPCTKAFGL